MPTASPPRTNRHSWLRRSAISLRARDPDASRNQSSRRVRGEVGREPSLGRRPPAALLRRLRQEVLRSGKLARFTATGLDRLLDLPMPNPSDVAFGGPALDRLFVTSIAFDLGEGVAPPPEAGWLLALDHVGSVGRPESRFSLGWLDER